MSDLSSSNFYKILGVEPTADERAIKKAYFALMRKYPPETHAEQFMKLREAYEVLSNPDARKEYDTMGTQDDGHAAEQVRLATEAIEGGRYPEAQQILARLLNEKPELDFARDLLGMAFLHGKQADAALEIFEELVVKHPANGSYQMHRGHAHHVKKELKAAEAAYLKAVELSPDDVRPLVSLSDCYADQKRWDDALKVLDKAIHLDGSVDFRDFGLFVRKLEVEMERKDSAAMARTLESLMPIIPDDPKSKRFVADRLGSLAAPLFAQQRVDDANLLMKYAAQVDPKRGTGRMPNTFEVETETLPEASKAWLVAQKNKPSDDKINNSAMGWPIFWLLVSGGGVLWAWGQAFASYRPLGSGGLTVLFVGMSLALLLAAWSLRGIIEASKSPYGAYTIVHPLYLLQVRPWKLIAWPLANLHDVKITHHYTNGVYSTTRIELIFNGRTFNHSIYGQEKAVEWANRVLAKRRRMLELMHAGLLEDGAAETNLIPAELVPQEGVTKPSERAKARTKRGYIGAGAAVGLAGLATLIAIPLDQVKRDNRAWENATGYGYNTSKVTRYKKYLAQHPEGRHADEAKKAIDDVYAKAEARVKQHQSSEMAKGLLELVQTLREKGASRVGVKYESKTAFEKLDLNKLPDDLRGKIIDPRLAFTAKANQVREAQITESLGKAFDKLLGDDVVEVGKPKYGSYDYDDDYSSRSRSKKTEEPEPPVTLVVKYEVALNGSIYESVKESGYGGTQKKTDRKFLGTQFYWDFEMLFSGDEKPRYTFEFDSEPAKNISWTSYGSRYNYGNYDSSTLPYDKMAGSAFDDFQHQIAVRFGVEAATPKPKVAPKYEDDDFDDVDSPAPPPAAHKPAPKKLGKAPR
ncbi:MAG: DnaJ domain-containing protein [Myxococcaceae bacterium]|nr:DnaJ domain-containing protein [Myxococcaceae bacterium]